MWYQNVKQASGASGGAYTGENRRAVSFSMRGLDDSMNK